MFLDTTLQDTHAPPDLGWTERITSIERDRLVRYAAHAAILLIVLLSALVAL